MPSSIDEQNAQTKVQRVKRKKAAEDEFKTLQTKITGGFSFINSAEEAENQREDGTAMVITNRSRNCSKDASTMSPQANRNRFM